MPSDEPELNNTTKTETTVRHFDSEGNVTSEVVTVVVHKTKTNPDDRTGMYL